MKLGLQVSRFPRGDDAAIAPALKAIAQAAETAGFSSLWLMDHLFQIRSVGKVDEAMLEAYTTLGFLAACTERIELGTMVTDVHFRQPGLLVKQVTTLDVLSNGRAWLGIGAGWYEREAKGLGLAFPPVKERFEHLDETLRIAHQMWRGDISPFYGKHHQLQEPINSPKPIRQPRPKILIGGGGEKQTLRFVAKYADACNLFARLPDWQHKRKLGVLKRHCEEAGRDYDAIEKTVLGQWDPLKNPAKMLDDVRHYEELGFQTMIVSLKDVETIRPIEVIGAELIPRLSSAA